MLAKPIIYNCFIVNFKIPFKMVMNVSGAMRRDQYFDWVYFSISQYNFQALTRPYVKWRDVFIARISEMFMTNVYNTCNL